MTQTFCSSSLYWIAIPEVCLCLTKLLGENDSAKCDHCKERVSIVITTDVSIHICVTQISFCGDKNVWLPEHLISVLIFSSQFCARFSQLWVVFPGLFVPLFEWTSRLDPLNPCAWQTKVLSTSSQFATQRYFHVPSLRISIDPLEEKPSIVRKRTGNSRKEKDSGDCG